MRKSNSKVNPKELISDLQEAIEKTDEEEIHIAEMKIKPHIQAVIEEKEFYDLPFDNIVSLIKVSEIEIDVHGVDLCKTILHNYSEKDPFEAIKLLQVLDFDSIALPDCIELFGSLHKCKLCQTLKHLYQTEIEEAINYDVDFEIDKRDRRIEELEKDKEESNSDDELEKYNEPLPELPKERKKPKNFQPDITIAASEGNLDSVNYLVRTGTYINTKNELGNTALHCAVASKQVPVMRYLIDYGANTEEKNNKGMTPLLIAVSFNMREIVIFLLSKHVNIDAQDKRGFTGLHIASQTGNFEMVKILVEHNANLEVTDNWGFTAIYRANKGGHLDIVNYLLQKGADQQDIYREGEDGAESANAEECRI